MRISKRKMKYLFIIAHPDDEVDVGGTIHKLTRDGNEVAVAILVEKVAIRRNLSIKLALEEQESMDILSVDKVYHADFPNIKTNVVPHLELVRFIEYCIDDWKAEAVVTHHSADVNIDHVITSTAAIAAVRLFQRRVGVPRLKLVLMMESAGVTEWALDSSMNRFVANYFIEIGREGLDTKLRAHNVYKGVSRPYPHPYSNETYEGLAAYRGAQSGCNYAEAFECVFRSE